METSAVCEFNHAENLAQTLTNCRAALDELGAQVAAAHVDAALHALRRQFDLGPEDSTSE